MTEAATFPASDAGQALPLPCPNCGYDLRGNTSGVCPECGLVLDAEMLSREATIPWQQRGRVGRIRGFVRTLWATMRHPKRFASQAAREVDYHDARRFQAICCLLGWIGIGVPIVIGTFLLVRGINPVGMWPASLGAWLADGSIALAAGAGTFLWLLLSSGVPSYFFHPKDRPRELQDRAIALSYYTAAPLALMPLAMGITLAAVFVSETLAGGTPGTVSLLLQAAGWLVAGVAILLLLAELVALPLIFLRHGLHASGTRLVACWLTLVVGWHVLFILCVLGLTFLVFYVQLAWHALQ